MFCFFRFKYFNVFVFNVTCIDLFVMQCYYYLPFINMSFFFYSVIIPFLFILSFLYEFNIYE